jgi:hypothetical protein
MRVFIGFVIGLLLGLGAAFFVYPLSEGGGSVTMQKSDKEPLPTSDAFYICSAEFTKDIPLIIKSVNGVAKAITLPWVDGSSDYNVEKTDDLNYTAFARREDGGYDILALNRVTGKLDFADHPSNGSKALLTDLCAQRVDWRECESRMPSVKGGRKNECIFVINEFSCPRLKNLGLVLEVHFQCAPTERRF